MTAFRQLRNGILIAPARGKPPKPPEGYERMPGNKYIFRPILESCKYRELRHPDNRCCGKSDYTFCIFLNSRITAAKCMGCDETTC